MVHVLDIEYGYASIEKHFLEFELLNFSFLLSMTFFLNFFSNALRNAKVTVFSQISNIKCYPLLDIHMHTSNSHTNK